MSFYVFIILTLSYNVENYLQLRFIFCEIRIVIIQPGKTENLEKKIVMHQKDTCGTTSNEIVY